MSTPRNVMWSCEPRTITGDIVERLPPVARAHIATVQQIHAARDTAVAAGLTDLAAFLARMSKEAIDRHHKYMDPDGPDQAHMRKHGLADEKGLMISSN